MGHYPLICTGLKTLDALRVPPPLYLPPDAGVPALRREIAPKPAFLGTFDPRGASRSGKLRPAQVLGRTSGSLAVSSLVRGARCGGTLLPSVSTPHAASTASTVARDAAARRGPRRTHRSVANSDRSRLANPPYSAHSRSTNRAAPQCGSTAVGRARRQTAL